MKDKRWSYLHLFFTPLYTKQAKHFYQCKLLSTDGSLQISASVLTLLKPRYHSQSFCPPQSQSCLPKFTDPALTQLDFQFVTTKGECLLTGNGLALHFGAHFIIFSKGEPIRTKFTWEQTTSSVDCQETSVEVIEGFAHISNKSKTTESTESQPLMV